MIVTSFNDVFHTLVEAEVDYIAALEKEQKKTLRWLLDVKDLSNWTIMNKVYEMMEDTYPYWNHMIAYTDERLDEIDNRRICAIASSYHHGDKLIIDHHGDVMRNGILAIEVPFFLSNFSNYLTYYGETRHVYSGKL